MPAFFAWLEGICGILGFIRIIWTAGMAGIFRLVRILYRRGTVSAFIASRISGIYRIVCYLRI
jgi:hypothetical protein